MSQRAPGPPFSGLLGPLGGSPGADSELDDAALLAAMLEVEAALARAQADCGLIPAAAADEIEDACDPAGYDPAAIGAASAASASPVVPLVRELNRRVTASAAPYVHFGTTSQDVIDSALALVARRALEPVLDDLGAACERLALLAGEHRHTLMPARTLLQHALPTTFGLRCAGWLTAVDEAAGELRRVRVEALAVQLGGAAGTMAAYGEDGPRLARALARRLGLAAAPLPWHTDRTRPVRLASAAGAAIGTLGKIGVDVALLAQTEVAEVSEGGASGRGGSSALPHKRNPVGAVLLTAAATRAPGLVATLLAAMPQEHERAAGRWQAEWQPLRELLHLLGGAAANGRELIDGLRVDERRMRAGVDLTHGLLGAGAAAGLLARGLGKERADEAVAAASRRAVDDGIQFADALLADAEIAAHVDATELADALAPERCLPAIDALIDGALAAHRG